MSYEETVKKALELMVPGPVVKALIDGARTKGEPLRRFVGNVLSEWWIVKVVAEEFPTWVEDHDQTQE